MAPRKAAHGFDERIEARQHHLVARLAEHQRVGKVVDVLGSAGEVDELEPALRLLVLAELRAQPVLDRLDVVIRLRLDVLDVLGVALREVFDQFPEGADSFRREGLQFLQCALGGERLEPLELDPDPVGDERLLAEVDPQGIESLGVPAVEGGQRGERRWHGPLLYGR